MVSEVACDLCGSTNSNVLFEKNEYWVNAGHWVMRAKSGAILHGRNVFCEDCGLIYISPRLSEEELSEYYRTQYRDTLEKYGGIADISERMLAMGVYNALHNRDFVVRHMQVQPGMKALDIGCHTGALLAHLQKAGFEPYGIEPDPTSVEQAKTLYGITNATSTTIEQYESDDGPFDLITICDCLEHVTSVTAVLKKIRSLLTDKGRMVCALPTWSFPSVSIPAHFSCAHTYTFSEETITAYLHKTGFKVIAIEHSGHAKTMMVMAEAAEVVEDYLPKAPENYWQVKCHIEKYQELKNNFNFLDTFSEDGKFDAENAKNVKLFKMILGFVEQSDWFPSYTALRLSNLYRKFGNKEKEKELLKKSIRSEDVEDMNCGPFDCYLRLLQIYGSDPELSKEYLSKAEKYAVNVEEVVWPNVDNAEETFYKFFSSLRYYNDLKKDLK